jgi:hypothetical protein
LGGDSVDIASDDLRAGGKKAGGDDAPGAASAGGDKNSERW